MVEQQRELTPREQFEHMLPYAQNNPYGKALWFGYDGFNNHTYEVWQLSHVESPGLGSEETAPQDDFRPDTYHYHYLRWSTRNAVDIQQVVEKHRTDDSPEPQSRWPELQVLGVPQLCARFLHYPHSADDIGRFAEVYLDWASQHMGGPYSRTSYSVLFRLALSGILAEEKPLADPSSRVNRALAAIPPKAPHFKRVSGSLSRALGCILAGKLPPAQVVRIGLAELPAYREDVLAAAHTLDTLGVLPLNFWEANDIPREKRG